MVRSTNSEAPHHTVSFNLLLLSVFSPDILVSTLFSDTFNNMLPHYDEIPSFTYQIPVIRIMSQLKVVCQQYSLLVQMDE